MKLKIRDGDVSLERQILRHFLSVLMGAKSIQQPSLDDIDQEASCQHTGNAGVHSLVVYETSSDRPSMISSLVCLFDGSGITSL